MRSRLKTVIAFAGLLILSLANGGYYAAVLSSTSMVSLGELASQKINGADCVVINDYAYCKGNEYGVDSCENNYKCDNAGKKCSEDVVYSDAEAFGQYYFAVDAFNRYGNTLILAQKQYFCTGFWTCGGCKQAGGFGGWDCVSTKATGTGYWLVFDGEYYAGDDCDYYGS